MSPVLPNPIARVDRVAWRDGEARRGARAIPEETAVALTYNLFTHAVMMATPADLEDFAVGFSLAEGVITAASQIEDIEVHAEAAGIELRMWVAEAQALALKDRRRRIAGPTGCGLCGVHSLEQAVREAPRVTAELTVVAPALLEAMNEIASHQEINQATRAVHAAAFWRPGAGLVALREDVGRHNALDKLAGALARESIPASNGVVLLTSRVSVEMIQKATAMGAPIVCAVSAPTALAVRTAEAAGITLVAVAREDGFEVFAHPNRIEMSAHVRVA